MADLPDRKVAKTTPDGDYDDNGVIDRLSALPDGVLLHILSFFKTKDAAVSSVLSTRWRNLFISLPDVELSFIVDNDVSDRDRLFSDFISLGNRVIRQRKKAPIRKLVLHVEHFVESYRLAIESLMSAVAAISSSLNVQECWISLLIDKTEPLSVSVSPGIFTCKTIVSLSLNGQVDWIVPSLVSLPNLKFLYLHEFKLVDEDAIRRVLQGCPLLEKLMLFMRPFDNESESEGIGVKVLDISSPSLNNLFLYWDQEVEFEFNVVVKSNNLEFMFCFLKGQHKVTIDAPNLKYLNIEGHVHEVNIIQNLMSLDNAVVSADFLHNVTTDVALFLHSQHAFKFMSGLHYAKSLELSVDILKALYVSLRVLPTFKNLIKLELRSFYCHAFISKMFSSIFESSPNLEVLIFNKVFKSHSEDEEFDSFFPEALPITFVEHLKETEISNFEGEEHEFKLVEYFLKNGKSLKKMALIRKSWKSVSEGCERILSFKKCSEDCQIVFKKKWDWIECPQLRKSLDLSP